VNFYKHYIGDFQRDTGHLSLTERGAYLCLMHHYYATEKPLPNDHQALCRVAGAITKSERDAVRAAMRFFDAVDSGLMHSRIEAELHKAGDVSSTNRDIALAREAKRRAEKSARTEHEACTKRALDVPRTEHEQSTNQTPDTSKDISKPLASHPLSGGFPVFWQAWPKSERKHDKAKCLAHWRLHSLDAVGPAILADMAVKRATTKWSDGFIEAPLVYLRGKRWEDGVEPDPEAARGASPTVPQSPGSVAAAATREAEERAHAEQVAAVTPERRAAIIARLADSMARMGVRA